jgi:eukaryotic-like serine/threonine-protein kinase
VTDGARAPGRNAEIDAAFAVALDLEGAERTAFLARRRGTDPDLVAAVERLLAASAHSDPRLDPDRWVGRRIWIPSEPPPPPRRQGERVGPYRVLREIGRGGMSVVYLAERVDGLFEQRVALKFLGVSHEVGVRRFQQERRILAGLTHPNIARLLDGGSDEWGRPYIVMEYIDGRPLDVFCDASGADIQRRLDLVLVVAGAVEYAHRNLVIHRDLKPTNILVTDDGHVKLLDFGIAKLLTPPESGGVGAPATQTLLRALTPEYASPEQVRGERMTTASDIYQLGTLLYELLAGARPVSLAGASIAEVERAICQGDPPPPSRMVARERRTPPGLEDPLTHQRRLRGDLDTIVLKAMATEPERRYASVGALRDDLLRFRQGVPIRARTPTPLYRTAKFVRRNRVGVAAAMALAGVIAIYLVTVTVQSRRIVAEAAKAEQVKEMLVSLFTAANPAVSQGQEPTASDLLDMGARRVAELQGQPDVQAELMAVLGQVYGTLGRYDEAADLLLPALELRRRHMGPSDPEVARTAHQLADIRHIQGRLDEAERLMREAVDIRRRTLGERSGHVGATLGDLGDLLHSRGQLLEAETVLRRGLAIQRSARFDTVTTQRHLANVYRDRGAFERAESLYRSSLAASEARFGVVDPVASLTRSELALLLAETGRHGEAESLLRQNLGIYEALYPGGHAMVGTTLRNLGILRLRQGQPEAARELLERAVAVYGETLGEETSLIPRTRRYIAEALLAMRQPEAAGREATEAIESLQARGLEGHPAVADALETLAGAALAKGRVPDAVHLLEGALALRERLSVPSDPRLEVARTRLVGVRTAAAPGGPGLP